MSCIITMTGLRTDLPWFTALELMASGFQVHISSQTEINREDMATLRELTPPGCKVTITQVDMFDPEAVEAFFNGHLWARAVIHFAASPQAHRDPGSSMVIHRNIIDAVSRRPRMRLVASSSLAVYSDAGFLKERNELEPLGPRCRKGWQAYQLEAALKTNRKNLSIALRFAHVAGAAHLGRMPVVDGGPVNWVAEAGAGLRDGVRDDGEGRNYIHPSDAASAVRLAVNMKAPKGHSFVAVNVCGAEATTGELAAIMTDVAGVEIPVQHHDAMPQRAYCTKRARNLLGFEAVFGIRYICQTALDAVRRAQLAD